MPLHEFDCGPHGGKCHVTKSYIEDTIRESPVIREIKTEIDDMHTFIHGDDRDFEKTSFKGVVYGMRSDMHDVQRKVGLMTKAIYTVAIAVVTSAVLMYLGLR